MTIVQERLGKASRLPDLGMDWYATVTSSAVHLGGGIPPLRIRSGQALVHGTGKDGERDRSKVNYPTLTLKNTTLGWGTRGSVPKTGVVFRCVLQLFYC
jgi:hypothetical protein